MPPVGRRTQDTYADYDATLAGAPPLGNPWAPPATFTPDDALLASLLTIPVTSGVPITSGRFPKAIDVWVAHELRKAGFDSGAVWPRAVRPRVLPRSLSRVLQILPRADRANVEARVSRITNSGLPTEAYVLGEFKRKQVDVVMAEWDRGVELAVTTKTMSSSEANNIANRYEEYIGEIRNLRGRFPLASIGLLWLVRSTIGPRQFEQLTHVVHSLMEMRNPNGYDAGGVIVAHWTPGSTVTLQQATVPADLQLGMFMQRLIDRLLAATPLDDHVNARAMRP
jgi:hypothetical protein